MSFWFIFILLAFFGALIRFKTGQHLQAPFPWATLLVNSVGSFCIGLCHSWQMGRGGPAWIPLITVAFLGSLTTFSSFSLDTIKLLQTGQLALAGVNFLSNNVLSLALCYLGIRVLQ